MTVLVMRNTIFPTLSCIKSSASSDFTLGNVEIVSELARILCLQVQCTEVTFIQPTNIHEAYVKSKEFSLLWMVIQRQEMASAFQEAYS